MKPPDRDDERKKTSPEEESGKPGDEADTSDPDQASEGEAAELPSDRDDRETPAEREDIDEIGDPHLSAPSELGIRDGTTPAGRPAEPAGKGPGVVSGLPPAKPVGADERDAARSEAATASSDLGRQDATADVEPGIRDEDEGERTAPDAGAPKQSEPASGPAPPAPPPPAERAGGRFWPGFVGAVVGAAVGAAAVWFILEQLPREADPEVAAAIERITAQGESVTTLESDLAALREEVGANDLADTLEALRGDTDTRIGGLDEALTAIAARLEALEAGYEEIGGAVGEATSGLEAVAARIEELEARPIADPETANQVLRSEVADMRAEVEQATQEAREQVETMRNELAEAAAATQSRIEEAEARAAELEAEARERAAEAEAEAQAAARATEARAALAQIEAALDSGEPYGEALNTLAANAETEVPEALAAPAASGVPTLAELRESFPDAAREALSASRVATTEGDPGSRMIAFLRTQTGARSLTPQEGDTPDAVLSRAEAELRDGDVEAALAELEALPEDGRAAMQDWIDSAEVRADAAAAADSLSQGMN